MANPDFADFRSVVTLFRQETISYSDSEETETIDLQPVQVRASIVPTNPTDFIGNTQIKIDINFVTHYAIMYTHPQIDIFDKMIRNIRLADGTSRRECYRLLGAMFIDTECRFMKVEMQLESVNAN